MLRTDVVKHSRLPSLARRKLHSGGEVDPKPESLWRKGESSELWFPKRAGAAAHRRRQMPRKGRSNEQIIHAPHEIEATKSGVCCKLGIKRSDVARLKEAICRARALAADGGAHPAKSIVFWPRTTVLDQACRTA